MSDFLRSFRLGIINLLGITVPGIVFLFFLLVGVISPAYVLLQQLIILVDPTIVLPDLTKLAPLGQLSPTFLALLALVLAYVIGYIFRLSTPDDLDRESKKYVLESEKEKNLIRDQWPYRGEEENATEENKFPYFYFREYLEHRGHSDLAELVKWSSQTEGGEKETFPRSKTSVNRMKIETAMRCPTAAAIIESNEAHIRLMFGVWLAIKWTQNMFRAGFLSAVFSSAFWVALYIAQSLEWIAKERVAPPQPLWLFATALLFYGTPKVREQIEHLFHYRRVRELMDVVVCTFYSREAFDLAGNSIAGQKGSGKKTSNKPLQRDAAARRS